MRRTSVVQRPQLFNVVKCDMCIVRPRPALAYEISEYQKWHMRRLAARPGITEMWQGCGRGRVPFEEMVNLDVSHIGEQSLGRDFKSGIPTIPAVILGKGRGMRE